MCWKAAVKSSTAVWLEKSEALRPNALLRNNFSWLFQLSPLPGLWSVVGSLRSLRWAWGYQQTWLPAPNQLRGFIYRRPTGQQCPHRTVGPGNTAGAAPKFTASAREREGSLWLSSVTPSVLWYSEGKLMRVWRPVRKITASFIIKDKSQAEWIGSTWGAQKQKLDSTGVLGGHNASLYTAARAQQSGLGTLGWYSNLVLD